MPAKSEEDPHAPPDREANLVLLTGREEELQPLLEAGPTPDKGLHQHHPIWSWKRPNHVVKATYVGPGPRQTKRTLDKIRTILNCDLLLVTGTAGALDPEVEKGTLLSVSASGRPDQAGEDWFQPTPEIVRWLGQQTLQEIPAPKLYTGSSELGTNNFRSGALLTTDEPVLERERRLELHSTHGASAVDMETAVILKYCRDHLEQQPDEWAGLRVISDNVDQEDPGTVQSAQEPAITILTNALKRTLGMAPNTDIPDFSPPEPEEVPEETPEEH